MFITENQNIGDSVLFLLAARTALANIVESSKNDSKEELISFIYNEASDYQIMHLLTQGTLPEEKYNPVAETLLFSAFKESMLMNKDFVTEMVGEDIFENVLHEVDSLYMVSSTARPVLEFAAHSDLDMALALMITENPAQDAALIKNLNAKLINWTTDLKNATGATKTAIANKIAAAKSTIAAKSAALKGAGAAKMAAANQAAHKSVIAATKSAQSAPNLVHGRGLGGNATTAAKTKSAATYYGNKALAAGKSAAAKTGAALKAGAAKTAAAGKSAAAATSKFATTKAGMATGGAAAAALAIYAGYKIYKRFFSAAAKNCAGQSGAAKTACMNKFKKQAIMKQASAIQSASGTCAKSKDPAKCKAAVGKKVASLKAKAAAIAA